jgi:hypothetical protein
MNMAWPLISLAGFIGLSINFHHRYNALQNPVLIVRSLNYSGNNAIVLN